MAIKKKVTKKKVTKKKIIEEVKEDERKYLSIHECRQLELNSKDVEIERLNLEAKEAQLIIIESRYQLAKKCKELYEVELIKLKEGRRVFNKNLASKYELTGKWGFDPDSLEIKE